MFITWDRLTKAIREVMEDKWAETVEVARKMEENEKERYEKEIAGLKKDVEAQEKKFREAEHKKQMEERELTHLVKMKEEKIASETKKKELDLLEKSMAKEAELQTQYHEKVVALLEKHQEKFQHTYEEIMKRLPNVNVRLGDGGK